MKKSLFLIAVLSLALGVSSCGKKDSAKTKTPASNQTQNQTADDISENYAEGASENVNMKKLEGQDLKEEKSDSKSSATFEASEISIGDAKLVDIDGQQCVVVSYKFTNKANSAESFSSMMDAAVFQDGALLTKAVGDFELEGFDSNSTAERVEKGKTITVQEIYNITNDSPITVTVKEFHSTANVSVSKTFNLK